VAGIRVNAAPSAAPTTAARRGTDRRFSFGERNRFSVGGYYRIDMSSAPTTLAALYNAFTALIGYPQNMDATLTRRLEG